jgi:hypothetical protein
MTDPISPIPLPKPLATDELLNQVRKGLTSGLTGELRISFQRGKTLTLFAHQGRVRQFYIRNHRAPDTNWERPLTEGGRGELEIKTMPARGLLFRKILLESLVKVEPQPSTTNQLRTMFDLAGHNLNPTLFHIQWDFAEGFVLVAGRDISLHHAVLMSLAGGEEGSVALNQISAWNEPRCNVTVYRGNPQSQAWFEVHLNILFENYCSRILEQYGQLTGKVMIHSILWKIHTMSVEEGWNIETQNSEITDATIFPTARDAGDVYKKIVLEIVRHVEPIIGHALTQNILDDARNTAKGVYKTIMDEFDLSGKASS